VFLRIQGKTIMMAIEKLEKDLSGSRISSQSFYKREINGGS
jgi:hypothetical protein